jgi:hypothetical protein
MDDKAPDVVVLRVNLGHRPKAKPWHHHGSTWAGVLRQEAGRLTAPRYEQLVEQVLNLWSDGSHEGCESRDGRYLFDS